MEDNKEKDKVVASIEEFEKKASEEDKKDSKEEDNKEEKDSSIEISSVDELKSKKDASPSRIEAIEKNKKDRKTKKVKKRIRTLVVLFVIGLAIYIGGRYLGYKVSKELEKTTSETMIGEVKRMDISSTISTTGTVQSKDTRTITSALTGVTISKVNFEVGDMVNEGDVIVEFSREDIQDSIEQAQEDLDEARKSKAVADSYKSTDHNYDYESAGYAAASTANSTAQSLEGLNQANASLQRAKDDKAKYVEKYNTAVNNLPALQAEYDQATAYFDLFKATNKQQAFTPGDFPNDGSSYNEQQIINYLGYEYTVDGFENYISNLQSQISSYKSTISSYDTSSYDKSIISAEESLRSRELSYEASLISENDKNLSTNRSLNTSDYNYDSYLITAGDNVTKAERTLKQQQEKLDDYIVYAPISGIVTSVSAQEGNGYVNTSGGLMTIQAIDSYEITTQIDEYDINSVVEGQKVVIMTDATGDSELEGVVSFISPVTTSSSSSGSSGQTSTSGNTYEVKIDILTDDARIKLGMSAKLNIILETHTNVLSVSYDAIEEDDNGQNYVMVVDEKAKNASANDTQAGTGIAVEGIDGKPTGAPSGENKVDSDKKNDSFIKYLFTPKKDRKKVIEEAAGLSAAGKKVYVTIGLEDDYYTEVISDELKEGENVILNTDSGVSQNPFGMYGPGEPGM